MRQRTGDTPTLTAEVGHLNSDFSSEHLRLAPPARRVRLAEWLAGTAQTPLHTFKPTALKTFSESNGAMNLRARNSRTAREAVAGDTF